MVVVGPDDPFLRADHRVLRAERHPAGRDADGTGQRVGHDRHHLGDHHLGGGPDRRRVRRFGVRVGVERGNDATAGPLLELADTPYSTYLSLAITVAAQRLNGATGVYGDDGHSPAGTGRSCSRSGRPVPTAPANLPAAAAFPGGHRVDRVRCHRERGHAARRGGVPRRGGHYRPGELDSHPAVLPAPAVFPAGYVSTGVVPVGSPPGGPYTLAWSDEFDTPSTETRPRRLGRSSHRGDYYRTNDGGTEVQCTHTTGGLSVTGLCCRLPPATKAPPRRNRCAQPPAGRQTGTTPPA